VTETFLILLAGGVLLATAICNPRDVTLQWLRLGGIIALAMLGLSAFFWLRRDASSSATERAGYAICALAVCGQLALTQIARRHGQRIFALLSFIIAVAIAVQLLPTREALPVAAVPAFAGVAGTAGIALMEMLLGHAYLTASKMTMSPFQRLNNALSAALVYRALISIALAMILNSRHPRVMLWQVYGLYIGTRWLVGLVIPAIFVWMARDCIRRRATQSATGILYVAGILIFIGEIIGIYLVRQTNLPF
jgi:hypothetical protein